MPEFAQSPAMQLALELKALTRDDGVRLVELLTQLRGMVATAPTDLYAINGLSYAVALAGLVDEVRPLAWRGWELMNRVSHVPVDVRLNTGAALSEAGYVTEAKRCYELMVERDPSFAEFTNIENLAVRYGELAWLEKMLPANQIPSFLRDKNLAEGWADQQAAIERVLAGRVASSDNTLEHFDDGTRRLVLTYYTNARPVELGDLDTAVWTAVERLYIHHPHGPGALLGAVILNIEGPEIPLPVAS